MRDITADTNGALRIGPGTLYGTIKRMLAAGWIEETGERPDPALDDQRRRYYRLTNSGQKVAVAEARRIAGIVDVSRKRHLLSDPEILTQTRGA